MTRYAEALASLTLAAANQATTIEAAEQWERQEHLATQQRLIESLNALASRRQGAPLIPGGAPSTHPRSTRSTTP